MDERIDPERGDLDLGSVALAAYFVALILVVGALLLLPAVL